MESPSGKGEEGGSKSPMGFLSKFFQKPGGGRPADIVAALQPKQASADADKEERFRVLTAQLLLDSMPLGTFPDTVVDSVMRVLGDADLRGTGISAGGGGVATVAHLQEAVQLAGMSINQAAEAYADVANALLVSIVDSAVDAADHKDDAGALASLENAARFIVESGKVYNAVTPGANIAPIQYNGRARGGKLEDLYYRYAKAGTDMGSLLSGFLGGQEGAAPAAAAESPEERAEQLASLQFYFNIKEKRRDGIEQRIMRESMMDMAKSVGKLQSGGGGGEEGMDSLAQLLDGMLGKGGDAAQVPGFPSSDMLQGYSAEAAKMGLPDFSKLSPEEAAALSKDALSAVSLPAQLLCQRVRCLENMLLLMLAPGEGGAGAGPDDPAGRAGVRAHDGRKGGRPAAHGGPGQDVARPAAADGAGLRGDGGCLQAAGEDQVGKVAESGGSVSGLCTCVN
jgi:hypothetical protein